jgi:NAD+ kinase
MNHYRTRSVPKAGIIYNDIKPVACRAAVELKDKLAADGWEVCMATGSGGILGYFSPESSSLSYTD